MAVGAGLRRRSVLGAAALPLFGCQSQDRAIEGGFAGTHPERGHLMRSGAPASPAPTLRRTQVLIAGAGVAGLAAARALRQSGIEDFVLLDLEDDAGGNSRAGAIAGLACPLGAHYLPLPGDDAPHVQALLEELGLRRREAGRWVYDERHLCHSPQERLFFQGRWQAGLLPVEGVGAQTLAQYRSFAREVAQARRAAHFPLPVARNALAASHRALDAQRFSQWLDVRGLSDPQLRWYLDYCCRDDYGAGADVVSAWAGLHYFASRHGFQPPGDEAAGAEQEAVLTWPEGNGWLTRQLAQPLGDRLRTGQVVLRVEAGRHGVEVESIDVRSARLERWQARHCILALPAFVAMRVLQAPSTAVREAAASLRYAPWVVANLHLREPLAAGRGAAPAWDNVFHGSTALGYVDAGHQRLDPTPGPTVLSWYCAPGEAARAELLARPWTHWRDRALADLAPAHTDLRAKTTRVEVTRYGHAMSIPVPGTRSRLAGLPLQQGRVQLAHSDWAGYSVFEEAFTLGDTAGRAVARAGRT